MRIVESLILVFALAAVSSPAAAAPFCWRTALGLDTSSKLGNSAVPLDDYLRLRSEWKFKSNLSRLTPAAHVAEALAKYRAAVSPENRLTILMAFADSLTDEPVLGDIVESGGDRIGVRQKRGYKEPKWEIRRWRALLTLPKRDPYTPRDFLKFTWDVALALHEIRFHEARWPWNPGQSTFPVCFAERQADCGNDTFPNRALKTASNLKIRTPEIYADEVAKDLSDIESDMYPLREKMRAIDSEFTPNLVEKDGFKTYPLKNLIWPVLFQAPAMAVDYYLNGSFGEMSMFVAPFSAGALAGSYSLLQGHQLNQADAAIIPTIPTALNAKYETRFKTHLKIHYWLSNALRASAIYFALQYAPQVPEYVRSLPHIAQDTITAVMNIGQLKNIDPKALADEINRLTRENATNNQRRWTSEIYKLNGELVQAPDDKTLVRRRDFYSKELQAALQKYGDLRQ